MRTRIVLRAFSLTALSLGLAAQANATPILHLSSSAGGDVTIVDGGAGDSSAADGVVSFNGALAGWNINLTNGFSKPVFGSATEPLLDISSANFSSVGGPQTLDIWFTDTDFAPIGDAHVLASIGGTSYGTVSYNTYFDAGNNAFGTTTLLTSIGPSSQFAFSADAGSALSATPNPYSLTMFVRIFHDGSRPYQMTSFDATVKVPEPSSLLLVGAGLLALGLVARKRRFGLAPAALV